MPYTMGLLGAVPRVDVAEKTSLVPIEGIPPNLIHAPTGCSFAPRCPLVSEACLEGEPGALAGRRRRRRHARAPGRLHQDRRPGRRRWTSTGSSTPPRCPSPGSTPVPRADRKAVLELKTCASTSR